MDNYPDGMNMGDYDDYFFPPMECGHSSDDECECWCDGGEEQDAHQKEQCTGDNCTHLQCQSCGSSTEEKEYMINNLQRQDPRGKPMWVALTPTERKPLRFIPQHKLEEARVCGGCYAEYILEIKSKELII